MDITEQVGVVCAVIAIVIAIIDRRPIAKFVATFFIVIVTCHTLLDFIGVESEGSSLKDYSFYVFAFYDVLAIFFFRLYAKICTRSLYWIMGVSAAFGCFAVIETNIWVALTGSTGLGFWIYDEYMAALAILLLGMSAGEGMAWSNFINSDIRRKLHNFGALDSRANPRC